MQINVPVLGVNEKTLELLKKGKYDEVFEKPKYVENITAKQTGIPRFNGKSIFFCDAPDMKANNPNTPLKSCICLRVLSCMCHQT